MAALAPYTELKAVNLILRNMGEAPVNSLSGLVPLEASQARDTLTEVSQEVQKTGWFFNTEYHRLTPDVSGFIYLPANALHVEGFGSYDGLKVAARAGRKLYNMTPLQHGFVWTGPVDLKLVLGLDFDDLPSSARSYIGLRAARVMQVREVGDTVSMNEDQSDETRALAELHAEQLAAEPLSLMDSPSVGLSLTRTYTPS
jgi:hypothetical protein